jgi:hypothetical protein
VASPAQVVDRQDEADDDRRGEDRQCDALAAIEQLSRNAQSSARAFVNLFVEEVWKPFDEAGRPDDGWEEIIK